MGGEVHQPAFFREFRSCSAITRWVGRLWHRPTWNMKRSRRATASVATVTDSSGQDREVDDERDWKICTQEPTPGYPPDGGVIRLGAVLTGEDC
ncbi:hypothetical protein SSP531S_01120 [Streptomyces spongiicola]|uniref:Uncharacterized protein n=1 Tax=Streptomyces spongiicola TaxID=1690221 RepID=A0A388SSI0_9ACTN|nr:hypothetical protein SSP531S_01120 [Streptomyces spongiicola]